MVERIFPSYSKWPNVTEIPTRLIDDIMVGFLFKQYDNVRGIDRELRTISLPSTSQDLSNQDGTNNFYSFHFFGETATRKKLSDVVKL